MTRTVLLFALAASLALTACGADDAESSPTASASSRPTADAPAATASDSPQATGQAAPDGVEGLAPVDVTIAEGTDAPRAEGRSLQVPAGWEAEAWAAVPGARLAAWTPDGALLVSTGDRGEVVALRPTTDGRAPSATTILDGLDNPQGLAFADQATLIVGESTTIAAYDYSDGTATGRRVVADGLPAGGHASKAVVVDGDRVVFSLGSASNRDPADRESTPERAVVASVPVAGGDHEVIARGVRNGFGLALAPDGTVWTAVNQADNQPYPFDDDTGLYGTEDRGYINENPVEQVTRVEEGGDLGWPYCVPDARDGNLDLPFVNDPALNPDGAALDCAALTPTAVGLPSHSAPLGLTFTHDAGATELGDGAVVTMHGSWNREPPREPGIAFLPWDADEATLGEPVALVSGFQDADGSRWGRVVATAIGPGGDLYVTDDEAGLVYRIGPAN
ncbi:sorbosone dehydrogenase family protein [Demequina sp. NBRC 110057]|uniref:PQQ-dependent sugar dehydrogenase n=1 Tax=Demequina sp. NBRC 110057 TaxID=1570346 RepID=UPI000A04699B|nr:sugar dehydrogenase [Demequina sp. NBRC 110057]